MCGGERLSAASEHDHTMNVSNLSSGVLLCHRQLPEASLVYMILQKTVEWSLNLKHLFKQMLGLLGGIHGKQQRS